VPVRLRKINHIVAEVEEETAKVPRNLGRLVADRLKDDPTLCWDEAVHHIVMETTES
jgi:hypothetical protein